MPRREAPVSQEEMKAFRLPIEYRDWCAHLLIPLSQCRNREFYAPWKCSDERHAYEKCQYEEFVRRVELQQKIDKLKAAKEAKQKRKEAEALKDAA